jgi:xanthine/uracil/vitamin C permease (AzgA family)
VLYVDILDTIGMPYSETKFVGLHLDPFDKRPGIPEGGKIGLMAIMTGFPFFFFGLLLPILSNIPSWAPGGALVTVGTLMIRNVREINWDYIGDAFPAFYAII